MDTAGYRRRDHKESDMTEHALVCHCHQKIKSFTTIRQVQFGYGKNTKASGQMRVCEKHTNPWANLFKSQFAWLEKHEFLTSLVVQCLRFCASTAGGAGLILVGELRSQLLWGTAKNLKIRINKDIFQKKKKKNMDSPGGGSVHAQSCPALCNPMDCSPPGSSVHGIFQVIILEWVAITYSRGSSSFRDQNCVSLVSHISRQILYHWATWEVSWSLQPLLFVYWIWGWAVRCTESGGVLGNGSLHAHPIQDSGTPQGPGWGGEPSLGNWSDSPWCPAFPAFRATKLTIHCASLPRWLLNLFHNQIESKFRRVLESKVSLSKQLALRSFSWVGCRFSVISGLEQP